MFPLSVFVCVCVCVYVLWVCALCPAVHACVFCYVWARVCVCCVVYVRVCVRYVMR